jgi:hypothetical protein
MNQKTIDVFLISDGILFLNFLQNSTYEIEPA